LWLLGGAGGAPPGNPTMETNVCQYYASIRVLSIPE
jgi:hypothetical protein